MQRAPQPARATATPSTIVHATAAAVDAKTSARGAVRAALPSSSAAAKGVAVAQPPRKALQALDGNRSLLPVTATVAPPPAAAAKAVAKAPFAYVSRFSRPLPSATATTTRPTTTTTTTTTAVSLTGLKRKQRNHEEQAAMVQQKQQLEPALPHQQQQQKAADAESAVAAEEAPLEQQRRENVAWLDMLVALLERKYRAHAPPVCVDDLERARMLDAYWPKKAQTDCTPPMSAASDPSSSSSSSSSCSVKRSRLSLPTSTASAIGGNAEGVLSLDEKDEKRAQALRRHAQQIQDTSVSSTSCCGCKTGCLKMYCVCFSTRGYCHDGCSCDNCKNSRASADQRLEAITTYLTNDPRAFSYAAAVPMAGGALAPQGGGGGPIVRAGFFQLLPEKSSTVVLRGCRCKKSKCLKKYCECFQNGLGCGPHCRCVDCANDASAAARELRAKNKSEGVAAATAVANATGGSASGASGGFHAIKVAVTKKPRRNYVAKSVRLRL